MRAATLKDDQGVLPLIGPRACMHVDPSICLISVLACHYSVSFLSLNSWRRLVSVYPLPSTRAWAIGVAPDSLHDLGSAAAASGVAAAPPLCFPTMAADGAPDSPFATLFTYLTMVMASPFPRVFMVPYTAGSSIRKFLLGQYLSPFTTEVVACLLPHTIALSSWSSPTYRRPCPRRPLSPHLCSCSSECSCHQDLGVTRSSTSPQRFLVLIHCDLIENK
jgi:hypothetical protein